MEEYDTLRIRYERKLGNAEEVSRLQEAKGFKSSRIIEKQNKKEKYYDDFVDGYSSVESDEYSEITSKSVFSKKTSRIILALFVIMAFGIGIMAGTSVLGNAQDNSQVNITVTDSAFSSNQTVVSADNLTQDNLTDNLTKANAKNSNATKTAAKKSSSKKSSSSSYSSYSSNTDKYGSSSQRSSSQGSDSQSNNHQGSSGNKSG